MGACGTTAREPNGHLLFTRRPSWLPILARVFSRVAASLAVLLGTSLSAAAQASALPTGDFPGQLNFGGLDRTYQVHVPRNGQPSGLVINLHGAGQTGAVQSSLTNFNAVADQNGFVVAYPDGIDLSWADGRGASIPDRQGVDDVGFLSAVVDRLVRDYGIPPGRIYATGMSAGAFMATRLACDRADLIAAIAPVAGTLGSGQPCFPSRAVSVLQIHGTADGVVPFGGGSMVGRGGASDVISAPSFAERWRTADGCPAPVEQVDGPVHRFNAGGCAGGTSVDFVQVDGGGHDWHQPNFNSSGAIGQFFATHGR